MTVNTSAQKDIIRAMVRSSYDLQQLRITIGNRVGANFRLKLGTAEIKDASKDQEEAVNKKILDELTEDYEKFLQLTDGTVDPEGFSKLPSVKRFKPTGRITTYAELAIVKAYVDIYRNEESQFNSLKSILAGYPLYEDFLSKVDGLGPQLSAVIISEIDWRQCEYPSSLWKYCGVDVVKAGYYLDANGVKQTILGYELELMFEATNYNPDTPLLKDGKYPVFFEDVGRSRKKDSLVLKSYTSKDGVASTRPGITFNPFLKTKLIGVLGTSFIRTGTRVMVNGARMGTALRLKVAKGCGYEGEATSEAVIAHLVSKGHQVQIERTKYAQIYTDYRNRLDRNPKHDSKTGLHKHNMAIRYMVKRFLVDLYEAGRYSEGLPIAPEYAVAKLGLVHGQVSSGKEIEYHQSL